MRPGDPRGQQMRPSHSRGHGSSTVQNGNAVTQTHLPVFKPGKLIHTCMSAISVIFYWDLHDLLLPVSSGFLPQSKNINLMGTLIGPCCKCACVTVIRIKLRCQGDADLLLRMRLTDMRC